MRPNIHPPYEPVVFRDRSTGSMFLTRSTLRPEKTVELDGRMYPVIDVEISSDSHPFWTGRSRTLDSEGRVQAFHRRYGRRSDPGQSDPRQPEATATGDVVANDAVAEASR